MRKRDSASLFLIVLGAKLEKQGKGQQILAKSREIADEIPLFQVVDAALVAGKEHLLSSFWHAFCHFNAGRRISSHLSLEVLLYAAGVRQINQAISSLGIHDSTKTIALIAGSPDLSGLRKKVSVFLKDINAQHDDTVLEMNSTKEDSLARELWGISMRVDQDFVLQKIAETPLLISKKQ
ncbi:MAG: KEOPS complex subunit Cgi121 [Candidatus Heimdallarchaeota archaeon]